MPKPPTIRTNTGLIYTQTPFSLRCDLYRPVSGGPFPVVVMCVDGGFTNNDFATAKDEAIRLAKEEGFAAVIPQFRTVPGAIAPAPMEDCARLIDWIVSHAATYNLDPDRVGAMGGSGGGYVALFLALGAYLTADQASRVKCVVGLSPPTDLRVLDDDGVTSAAIPTANFLGATEAASPETWDAMSPTHNVTAGTKPILLRYTDRDPIPGVQGDRLEAVLAANGVEHQMAVVPAVGDLWHGWQMTGIPSVWSALVDWFRTYLG